MWPYIEYCQRHGSLLQDYNEDGEPYRRPVCLDCRWESGKGRLLTKILRKASTAIKSAFRLHWGPETAYVRRDLTNRLNRAVKARFETLEEVAFAIAGPKRPQPLREERSEPVQTQLVMSVLRKFEERRGSVRTKQTPVERKEQDRIDTAARRQLGQAIDSEMLSLDDPNVAYAADFARYRELGGAKKRRTREMDLNEGADNR